MKANSAKTLLAMVGLLITGSLSASAQQALRVRIGQGGQYRISAPEGPGFALTAGVAAKINGQWLRSSDYPHHGVQQETAQGELGPMTAWEVTWSGLKDAPELICTVRAYNTRPFADVVVAVQNTTSATIHVQAIRVVDAHGSDIAALNGPAEQDRVLSDSFSEDRPAMKIHDLADAEDGMHRAVGSQLIYNRASRESLFVGALASQRFLTILRLHVNKAAAQITSYEVDSTGTTEMEKENSLQQSPAQDQIELSLPVAPGGEIESERVLMSVDRDYHQQLETYGALIRQIHHARVDAPPLMGWWSWTAFYFGLNEGAALTNAEWEAQHLKPYGYDVFHIDEGYQYARGEYITPNATLFPNGMSSMEYKIRGLGLLPGIWTAPFEVSERSWVYENHKDWLVKNAQGKPIPAGSVVDGKDKLFILDVTNPGAAEYLRQTYWTLVHVWDIHYIKMDFMDDSAIEGYYYKPHTTAMEAQRIGLQIIRKAVGDDVYLDKDGSVMMNPVGYVDYGRISQDTGHTFSASQEAATGIAARYYMNRNYFVADPDAFSVSTQTIQDQDWHEGKAPATLNDARVAIALAAVSGGMFEIGDNLTSIEKTPDRVALLENSDLLDMVRLSRSSVPEDLMSYSATDGQPSIFYLKESFRQSILTVFNWTEKDTHHAIRLDSLGLASSAHYSITGVLDKEPFSGNADGTLQITTPAHSVVMLKVVNRDVPAEAPVIALEHPDVAKSGETVRLTARSTGNDPVLSCQWNFGDGVKLNGAEASHAWTEPGDYTVQVTAQGLDGRDTTQSFRMHVTGRMSTVFNPSDFRRYNGQER